MNHIQAQVYNKEDELMGTYERKGSGNIKLAWVWSESLDWLNYVKEITLEEMKPCKCETCSGYLLTLRRKAIDIFEQAYPVA